MHFGRLLFWKISVFQKRNCFEKVLILNKYLCWKNIYSQKADAVQKYLRQKKALLYVEQVPNNCPKYLPWKTTFSQKVAAQQKFHFEKTIYSENKLFWKRSSSEKVIALKKWLLRKNNCCVKVVTLRKREEAASTKNEKK